MFLLARYQQATLVRAVYWRSGDLRHTLGMVHYGSRCSPRNGWSEVAAAAGPGAAAGPARRTLCVFVGLQPASRQSRLFNLVFSSLCGNALQKLRLTTTTTRRKAFNLFYFLFGIRNYFLSRVMFSIMSI